MDKRKVIIDCDPGIDDSLAIMLALNSEELDVLGITIVSGNVHGEKGAKNALKILKKLNRLDVNVYIGEVNPIKRELITAEDTHGEDGLGETFLEEVTEVSYKEGAVDFIIESLKKEDDISIIALGPLTNIAMAIEREKEAMKNLKELVLMGGAFKSHGNCSQVAEFNFWVDPHGAEKVFNELEKSITMVGLDVTRDIVLTPNYIEMIKQFNEPLGDLIVDITRFYVDFHWMQERTLGCVINDPLAVAYFIDRSLCTGEEYYVDIVTEGKAIGMSLVDEGNFYRKNPNCLVLREVDSKKFMRMFLSRLFKEHIKDIDIVLNSDKYSY
ncbi:nucleoside hydrolase [Clostridium sardiniense]|uniref:Nucleoside hydrolase n=1 Tax=Clostridium sardiniense TaxID=29369 RepID=A0ABS7L1F5_CLOSR|nr:nucleoside hydrolase [Clostridium sardiniense]MBY0756906.1 nucleoside hydrolase [Clostridium sardiniense]MDQ0458751.1 purine nucleosidase [Clostridium sardiniense]